MDTDTKIQLYELARQYAVKPYQIKIESDSLADGTIVYIAIDAMMPDCKSQGNTIEEAKTNLAEARIDYIYALLEQRMPLPDYSFVQIQFGDFAFTIAELQSEIANLRIAFENLESIVKRICANNMPFD